jgi:regulator of replication initiation timing
MVDAEHSIDELVTLVEELQQRVAALERENEALRQENEQLRKTVQQQAEEIRRLEAKLKQYENAHTPSSKQRKPKTPRNQDDSTEEPADEAGDDGEDEGESESESEGEEDAADERFPGKPPGSGGGGVNVPHPDTEEHHTLEDDDLEEIDTRERTIIDIPEQPIVVTKHVIHIYEDAEGNEIEPEVDLRDGSYGRRLQTFVTLLRATFGASHEKISDLVQQLRPDLTFAPSTALEMTDKVARSLAAEREHLLEQVSDQSFVHMDETGLREDGANGWTWVFADPEHVVYEVDGSRSKAVPKGVMGGFDGTAVVDGYPAYNGYQTQRCWDHLTREVEETEIDGAAAVMHGLRREAKRTKQKPPPARDRFVRRAREEHFARLIDAIRTAGHEDVAGKLENALPDLFRGVLAPAIPLTNNHAERLLRKVVVHRKLWGCIRNEKGARFIENVLSCVETWKLQGKDVFAELQKATA